LVGPLCVPRCISNTSGGINGGDIVAGGDHNIMVRLGCLFTWGRNNFGQLGNGNTNNVSAPTQVDSSLGSWMVVGAGLYNSFATKGTTLSGWGRNDNGQLGDGTTVTRCRPIALTGRNPIACFTSGSHLQGSNYGVLAISCINNCGTINAWGKSTSELRYIQPVPVQTNESSWSCVAATDKNMIAIRADGNVFTWGYNCSGQIGNGTFAPQPQSVSSPVQLGSVGTGCAIAFGPDRAAVINTQSSLYTWGKNPDNMFLARQTQAFVPVKLDNQKWKEVSVSPLIRYTEGCCTCGDKLISYNTYYAGHTTAIRKDGALFAWGFNSYGQLGDGTFTKRNTPTRITNQSWSAISAGTYHTLGIRADGALFAWGRNNNGQIGDLSTVNRCSPVQIGTQSWVSVKSGKNHSLAIRADCRLFAWGSNQFGQLGNGTTTSSSSPIQIGTCSWCSIEPGLDSSLGITVNNTLFGWGYNCYGPLNNSNKICYSAPTQISGAWKCVALGATDRISRFASISATGDTCLTVAKGTNFALDTVGAFGDVEAMITATNKLSSCGFDKGNNTWSWSRINIGGDIIAGIRY
jgi:alpha-tubulin suppressor-like RCC1 family protein